MKIGGNNMMMTITLAYCSAEQAGPTVRQGTSLYERRKLRMHDKKVKVGNV